MKLKDIYDDPARPLSINEINFLIRNGYVFNKNTSENIYRCYSLFYRSLYKNFDKTIDALKSYDFEDVAFEKMDETLSFNIYDFLVDRFFCLDKKSVKLIQYNPLFLISSLNNDYTKTLDCLLKSNEREVFVVPSFDYENKLLLVKLVQENFVLNSKNVSLVKNSFVFLLASLKNDFASTIKALKYCDLNVINMDSTCVEKLMFFLFDELGLKMSELPKAIQNTIINYLSRYDDKSVDISYLIKLVEEGKLPITYFNSDVLYANNDLLCKTSDNYDEVVFLYTRMGSYNYYKFGESDEEKVLSFLKYKYGDCECVEDVLRCMYLKKLTRDKMTLMELFAIQLYGAKELKKISSEAFIDMFALDSSFSKFGSYNGKAVKVFINSDNMSVLDMVNTLHHELEHVIQKQNIKQMKIDKDNDVDLYYKDEILREILLNEEYYEDNYNYIYYEYDADLKANIRTCALFNLVCFGNEGKLDSIDEDAMSSFIYGEDKVKYFCGYKRCVNGVVFDLNDLFVRQMEILRRENKEKFDEILNNYPMIEFEYNFDCVFERKSLLELFEDMCSCERKADKGIYFNLLKSRLDSNKEESQLVRKNVEFLVKLLKSNKYDGTNKKILEYLIEEYNKNDKYIKYFYKIKANRR